MEDNTLLGASSELGFSRYDILMLYSIYVHLVSFSYLVVHTFETYVLDDIPGAAVYDATMKGPEIIDMGMTLTLTGYSSLFMRFAWAVQPRNYLLFACHTFNVGAQLNQLRRAVEYKSKNVPGAEEEMSKLMKTVAAAGVGLAALMASAGRIKSVLASESMPGFVKNVAQHPAGR